MGGWLCEAILFSLYHLHTAATRVDRSMTRKKRAVRAAPYEVSLGPHFITSLSAFFVDCRIHLCATKVGQLKSNATLTLLALAML